VAGLEPRVDEPPPDRRKLLDTRTHMSIRCPPVIFVWKPKWPRGVKSRLTSGSTHGVVGRRHFTDSSRMRVDRVGGAGLRCLQRVAKQQDARRGVQSAVRLAVTSGHRRGPGACCPMLGMDQRRFFTTNDVHRLELGNLGRPGHAGPSVRLQSGALVLLVGVRGRHEFRDHAPVPGRDEVASGPAGAAPTQIRW
jgi:hypothetical protein